MSRRFKTLLASAGIASVLSVFAVLPARAETLGDAVQAALNHHPSVEAAIAGREAVRQERHEQFSKYFPELKANAAAGRVFGDNSTSRGLNTTRGQGYSWLGEGGITATQMLFDGFEVQSRVREASARQESANLDIMDVREDLAFRSVQAYTNLMRMRGGLGLILEHKKKVDDFIKRIGAMVDEGAADEAELQQAKDIAMMLESVLVDYKGQHEVALAEYAELTGRLPEGELSPPASPDESVPETDAEAIDFAKSNHPMLQSAVYTSKAAEKAVDAEWGTLYPDLTAELSYYKKSLDDVIGGEVIDAKGLVRMNWSFSTGGAQLARIKRKKYEHAESVANQQEMIRQIEREVRMAYAELTTAKAQSEVSAGRVKLVKDLLGTYENQFEGARITLLQLLQAENQVFNARLERLNSEYRLLAAKYGTLASMGRLQDFLNIVPVPDDDENNGPGFISFWPND